MLVFFVEQEYALGQERSRVKCPVHGLVGHSVQGPPSYPLGSWKPSECPHILLLNDLMITDPLKAHLNDMATLNTNVHTPTQWRSITWDCQVMSAMDKWIIQRLESIFCGKVFIFVAQWCPPLRSYTETEKKWEFLEMLHPVIGKQDENLFSDLGRSFLGSQVSEHEVHIVVITLSIIRIVTINCGYIYI